MRLFSPNIFNSAVFNTLAGIAKTRLFNRKVFGSPPLFNTGEGVIPPEPEVVESSSGGWGIDLVPLRRAYDEALQAQEAAERAAAEIIRQEREAEEQERRESIAERKRAAREQYEAIRGARRLAEAEAAAKKAEAVMLARQEAQARAEIARLEEEEAVAICLMALLS